MRRSRSVFGAAACVLVLLACVPHVAVAARSAFDR